MRSFSFTYAFTVRQSGPNLACKREHEVCSMSTATTGLVYGWQSGAKTDETRMRANAQRDGRPAEYRWRPLFNAAKFG